MDNFEKVERLVEKANVSFEDAKAALDEANGDLLDAMIILEKRGKVKGPEQSEYVSGKSEQTEYALHHCTIIVPFATFLTLKNRYNFYRFVVFYIGLLNIIK